jgi:DNA-binding beta-propeller fold protein YncE
MKTLLVSIGVWATAAIAAAASAGPYQSTGFLEIPSSVHLGAFSGVTIAPSGQIYVLQRGDTPLLAFDRNGKYERAWGQGLFKVPHGLRADRQGHIWTTDNGNHVVREFTADGKLLATIGEVDVAGAGPAHFHSPDDIVISSKGDLFVADSGNGRIVHLSRDGKFIAEWGRKGSGPSEFKMAHGLAIDQNDRIYVADRGNDRVQVFQPDGKLVTIWTGFGNPFGLLFVGKELLVTDGDANTISHLDKDGKVVAKWGEPGELQLPHFMALDPQDTLYLTEVNGKRVQKFRRRPATQTSGLSTISDSPELERIHAPLFQPPDTRSASVGQMTSELARSLPGGAAATKKIERHNYIDDFIFERMERDRIPHAAPASDEEFARRVWLDATGRLPPPQELLAFLSSKDPHKRDQLIDRLVDSSEFVDRWAYYFEDLFRAGSRMGPGLNLFHYWVREWLRLDRPYNEVVTGLLTGAGKTSYSVPGALYFARDFVKAKDDPETPDAHDLVNIPDTIDEFTVTYSKVFLGINLSCVSCHNGKGHLEKVNLFLARTTREQFFQQAAFYGHTRQIMNWENGYQANTEYTVDDVGPGYDTRAESIVRMPRSGGSGLPRFVLSGETPRPGFSERDELARILTGNVQFARAFTNRIWGELMGFGIVEPVDEFDLDRGDPKSPPPAPWTIQPSNPELLNAMASDFVQSGYHFRRFLKTVMKSSAYQLSSRFDGDWKPDYVPYYARKYVRMLSAAELHDAIVLATGTQGKSASGQKKVPMVTEMSEPKKAGKDVTAFLTVFGQSNRDDMPKKTTPSALQAMVLMESKVVTERVLARNNSRVEQLLKASPDNNAVVDQIYLATLSRRPSAEESRLALSAMAADRQRGAENLQWALINSPEFLFNY